MVPYRYLKAGGTGASQAPHCCPAKEVSWLSQSLCLGEGRLESSTGSWGGEEGYLQLLYMPSQGTCPWPKHLPSGLLQWQHWHQ